MYKYNSTYRLIFNNTTKTFYLHINSLYKNKQMQPIFKKQLTYIDIETIFNNMLIRFEDDLFHLCSSPV